MRKLHKAKYKKLHKKISKKKHRRFLDFKKNKKNKRRTYLKLNKYQREKYNQLHFKHKNYIKINAPRIFSFIDNTEGVSKFIEKLSTHFELRNKVFVVLDDIEVVKYDAIVVLLSIMIKFKSENIDFNGSFPKDQNAKFIITQSGFFENLIKRFKNEDRYSINPKANNIHTHAWKDVDAELGNEIIREATQTVWGEERRCQGVQRALLELMQNTNNHSNIGTEGEKHWWLSVNHIEEENKVCFSFVDFGVGVFMSLDNKTDKSKWFDWKPKLAKAFKFSTNLDVFRLILEGKLHSTVTKKHFRGKGLPGIKEVLDRNQISNLHIITNDVFSNVSGNNYKNIKTNFSGTFVYWELLKTNTNCYA